MKYIRIDGTEIGGKNENLCKAWQRHGRISEDGKVFEQYGLSDSHWIKEGNPVDNLIYLYNNYVPCPRFETCGGTFGRMLLSDYGDNALKGLTEPGELLSKVVNGWTFSGNFHDLSCAHGMFVGDKDIARRILEAIASAYDTDKYRQAVKNKYIKPENGLQFNSPHVDKSADHHVYYNSKNKSIYVAEPRIHGYLNGDESCFPTPREIKGWIPYAFKDAEYLGRRCDVDYAELLRSKMDDILTEIN